jgi:excinuclease ABC subunit A
MQEKEQIQIRGAREHNLKNINVDIPINSFTVITGLSGSGKSTLAFDTLYAEGQRRYVESLSAYARQFLGIMNKPDVDSIKGLSPAISIEQKSTSKNPRSTVGTTTEIYDYLRLLFARIGTPHCPECGREITSQTAEDVVSQLLLNNNSRTLNIYAPIVRSKKGTYEKLFKNLNKMGYAQIRIDGKIYKLDENVNDLKLKKYEKHDIEVLIDKIKITKDKPNRTRLTESVEIALDLADGIVMVSFEKQNKIFSTSLACVHCGINIEELQPRAFSFNSPFGACPECKGLGEIQDFAEDLIIPDKNLSIMEGAIRPWKTQVFGYRGQMLQVLADELGFSLNTPWKNLTKQQKETILYGHDKPLKFKFEAKTTDAFFSYSGVFEGIIPHLERLYKKTDSDERRAEMNKYMRIELCSVCGGKKLKPESLAVTINKKNIWQVTELPIAQSFKFFDNLKLTEKQEKISKQILKEIKDRLNFLINVGLDYLCLSRSSRTLSGGEAQRIRLATQIGSELRGVLYILDEPSIGLHQRDNKKLINTLKYLRDLGNTIIVVEHDEETIMSADHVIDIGPKSGIHGGKIVAQGTKNDIIKNKNSLTGQYLSGTKKIAVPEKRKIGREHIEIIGCQENNLKNISVKIPLHILTCVTGVSGSGKSTLVNETLYKGLMKNLHNSKDLPGKHSYIKNFGYLDKTIIIDQSPIGRTPRSNPVTYTKIFDHIRELFSQTQEAKIRGYKRGRFSFNIKGGRCEACEGAGLIKIEMNFLPDVYVCCEKCKGKRYNQETLNIHYKEKNIADVLDMSVEEASTFFANIPSVFEKLQTLADVGLGYIKLGQSATTLSGGEAQRIKLTSELAKRPSGRTIYFLDEPTTGLHFDDINKLLAVLNRLTDKGNTVVVIEHNLDVIKTADWIIDLGPEGGELGGKIVAQGKPEDIVKIKESYTGQFLKKHLLVKSLKKC